MALFEEAKAGLGELFIIGFNGLELSSETAAFITQAQIGGVILFSRNYENPAQVAELANEIQASRVGLPLWVSVDYEGGKVQRFKKGFTKIPDAAAIGSINSPKLAFEISEVISRELKAVGMNLNFAPVLDIAVSQKNAFIGNRSYGNTAEIVTKMGTAVVRGQMTQGIQPCVKHFPGHGDTTVDSHFHLPKVDIPIDLLEKRELTPFVKAFKSRCCMVMTAHILNSQIDSEFPATLSKKVLQDLLRTKMRYSGLIISDDMEMKAIADHYGADKAPWLAINAGCDLLIYPTETIARHAYEVLMQALENGQLTPERVLDSVHRIRSLKEKSLLPYHPVSIADLGNHLATPEHLAIVQRVEQPAITAK